MQQDLSISDVTEGRSRLAGGIRQEHDDLFVASGFQCIRAQLQHEVQAQEAKSSRNATRRLHISARSRAKL